MSKKIEKMYVLRLKQEEVAAIVEALTTMSRVEFDNSNPKAYLKLVQLISKIFEQASKSEK